MIGNSQRKGRFTKEEFYERVRVMDSIKIGCPPSLIASARNTSLIAKLKCEI
jgi:hypothetical protein